MMLHSLHDPQAIYQIKVTLLDIEPPIWRRIQSVCIEGSRVCPPEDCGGTGGYAHFLEAIRDRRHPEHHEWLEWVGGRFDPEAFDLIKVNQALKRFKS
jgi:hypothetical protein